MEEETMDSKNVGLILNCVSDWTDQRNDGSKKKRYYR